MLYRDDGNVCLKRDLSLTFFNISNSENKKLCKMINWHVVVYYGYACDIDLTSGGYICS